MNSRASFISAVLVSTVLCAASWASDDAGSCEPSLVGNVDSDMAYQQRDGRCEGIYKLEVGGEELRIESLVESFASFDPSLPQDLQVSWSVPPDTGGQVHLSANALLPRTFYRMDARVSLHQETFEWSCDLLYALGFVRDDLGVVASLDRSRDDGPMLYLPLRIQQTEDGVRGERYELAFSVRGALEEVYVGVVPANRAGEPLLPAVQIPMPLEYGSYPTDSPVYVDLPPLDVSGYYLISILLRFLDGGSEAEEFLIYHQQVTI